MRNSEEGSMITTIAYFWIFVVVVGTIGYIAWTNINHASTTSTDTNANQQVTAQKGDFNRDGRVDEIDRGYIRTELNCKKADPCWTVRVGKTSDGDNPIYTSDLDLNGDGNITEGDLP